MRVAIVDSGGANIGSVRYALERLGCTDAALTADPETIRTADRVILPGVGAAATAMACLAANGLDALLPTLTQPVLGICLGMQLLFEHSEEGATPLLGIIPGTAKRFPAAPGRRVPHMGWNQLEALEADPLLRGIAPGAYAYFVHSYALPVGAATIARCDYGGPFSAVVRHANFRAAQFHPERSARTGARLLANFLELAA